LTQSPQRQAHGQQVQEHVDRRRRPGLRVDVVALGRVLSIPAQPRRVDGLALKHGNKDEREQVAHVKRDDHVGGDAERSLGEDAQVEQQDRYFRKRQDAEVDVLVEEVNLRASV
jgi:hypothetical protein